MGLSDQMKILIFSISIVNYYHGSFLLEVNLKIIYEMTYEVTCASVQIPFKVN